MSVDIPDALAVEGVALDEPQYLAALGCHGDREILKQLQYRQSIAQTSARNFANHKRMHDDIRSFQQVDELRIATAQMIDPN
jgi:hypothetical protein